MPGLVGIGAIRQSLDFGRIAMKKRMRAAASRFLILLCSLQILAIPWVLAQGVGMVTGSEAGTYIQFGSEIAEVAEKNGLEILVKESDGSIDNIKRLASSENAAFGIVQADVLGFLARSKSPPLKDIAERLRLVFPLYGEEVHLFARKDINSFADLEGKRLVVGAKGSGNWLTAVNLLKLTDVKPGEVLNLSPSKGVAAVLAGKADAMIYVAGKPVKLFANLERLKSDPTYAERLDAVHFVPLDDPVMFEEYAESSISSADYPWYDGDVVPTIAVKAVLVSFDFSSKKNAYYRQRCEQLAVLGRSIRDNIDYLRANGHAKWREVRLDEDIGIWERDVCSRQVPEPRSQVDIVEELEAIILGE